MSLVITQKEITPKIAVRFMTENPTLTLLPPLSKRFISEFPTVFSSLFEDREEALRSRGLRVSDASGWEGCHRWIRMTVFDSDERPSVELGEATSDKLRDQWICLRIGNHHLLI